MPWTTAPSPIPVNRMQDGQCMTFTLALPHPCTPVGLVGAAVVFEIKLRHGHDLKPTRWLHEFAVFPGGMTLPDEIKQPRKYIGTFVVPPRLEGAPGQVWHVYQIGERFTKAADEPEQGEAVH